MHQSTFYMICDKFLKIPNHLKLEKVINCIKLKGKIKKNYEKLKKIKVQKLI